MIFSEVLEFLQDPGTFPSEARQIATAAPSAGRTLRRGERGGGRGAGRESPSEGNRETGFLSAARRLRARGVLTSEVFGSQKFDVVHTNFPQGKREYKTSLSKIFSSPDFRFFS